MCVITQLPHVPLLAATLWQGVPTSLRECVFGGGEVWQQTFAALYSKVSYADKTAVQFRAFADAAFPRRCCGNFLAMQRVSPKRPFGSENLVSLVRPSLRDDLSIKLATRLTIKP